jgi:hypothetical protein
MSTKTTFKRIALVAVAALGLGVLSVAPSSAVVISDSIALSASTTTITTGSTASVTLTTAGYFGATSDSITSIAALKTYPTGATSTEIGAAITTIAFSAIDTTTAYTGGSAGGSHQTASAATVVVGVDGGVAKLVSTRTKLSVTPTLVGTYTYTITPTVAAGGAVSATAVTWTVVVVAKAAATAASVANTAGSTLVYGYGYGGFYDGADRDASGAVFALPNATSTAALVTAGGMSCYTDRGFGAECFRGELVMSNGSTVAGAALLAADSPNLTYVVSGPGSVALWLNANPGYDVYSGSPSKVAYETTAGTNSGNDGNLTKKFVVLTDGTPGKITVTITSGTTVIATVSATAFGIAKTITPTVVNNPIVVSTTANAGTITALVKDETGALVRGATVYAVSDTVAAISNSYTSCGTTTSTGLVTCNLVGVAAGTANITLTTNSSATATTGISSTPVAVRVSDGVATKVDYKFDKETYAPGETAKITATVSNAAGVLPAGTYTVLSSAGVTANYTVAGLPAATVLAVLNTGVATYTVTIPTGVTGDLQLAGTAAATTITATFGKASVVNPAQETAQAAVDAAAEAIDAANAATDAANAAAEAADAATAAAQDAADAVAALSVSVAAMIDALKKQITSLTNLVIKIQKKVKA